MALRKIARAVVSVFVFSSVAVTNSLAIGSIPKEKLEQIKQCVVRKLDSHVVAHRLPWRTNTHYMAADNTSFSIAVFGYTACGQISHIHDGDEDGTTIANHVNSPSEGQVVEGRLLKGGNYEALALCGRYKFIAPYEKFYRGAEKHEVYGRINDDQKMATCGGYTAGGGFGKGGGHVYTACSTIIEPILDENDYKAFFKICAREVLP